MTALVERIAAQRTEIDLARAAAVAAMAPFVALGWIAARAFTLAAVVVSWAAAAVLVGWAAGRPDRSS